MIKHVIIWKLKESVENKEETMKSIKSALEGLTGKIEGLEKNARLNRQTSLFFG